MIYIYDLSHPKLQENTEFLMKYFILIQRSTTVRLQGGEIPKIIVINSSILGGSA